MNNSLKKILKQKLNEKDFEQYNEILKKEIIIIFVKKVQEKDSFFLYSNLVELLEYVEIYLEDNDIIIFTHFYDLCKRDYKSEDLSIYLTELYEKIVK